MRGNPVFRALSQCHEASCNQSVTSYHMETQTVKDSDNNPQSPARRQLFDRAGMLAVLAAMPSLSFASNAVGEAMTSNNNAAMKTLDRVMGNIEKACTLALARNTAKYPGAQASGLLHVFNNIALGLAMGLHDADPMNPEIYRYMGPDRKQGGDNADALYLGFAVDASQTYRLYGHRGSARYLSITTVEKDASTPWGGGMGAALYGRDLKTDADGNFEVIISAKPHSGNWLPITDKDFRVTIRQFFADWENEQPMRAVIERQGEPSPPPRMDADTILHSLEQTSEWLVLTIQYWQDTMDLFRKLPNQFISWREITGNKVNATPGGEPICGHWHVPEDQALIIRVTPPECEFWNIEFNNPWWETHDYRYHLSGTNMHHAVLEDNGELIAVIAHDDPGLPNWLDPAGHTEGMMGCRWIFAKDISNAKLQCKRVPRGELLQHLPKTVKRITPQHRRQQLASRRRGLYTRFGWM